MANSVSRRDPNAGKAVAEILQNKRGSINSAPLPRGFPGWEAVANMSWDEVKDRARRREVGFRELRKLLGDRRFNK